MERTTHRKHLYLRVSVTKVGVGITKYPPLLLFLFQLQLIAFPPIFAQTINFFLFVHLRYRTHSNVRTKNTAVLLNYGENDNLYHIQN